jgi:hypothetical protein
VGLHDRRCARGDCGDRVGWGHVMLRPQEAVAVPRVGCGVTAVRW